MALVPWRAVLVGGVLISVAGLVVGQAGVARLIVVVGFVAILVRTMRINRSIATGPWRLLLVGGVLALVQSIARVVHGGIVDQEYPFPSVADVIGLAAYAVMMAGGISMVRVRTRERRRENSTDAMIFAAVTGMITLNVFLAPYLHDGTVPVDERLLVLVYSISTLGLTAMAARISFGPGVRNEAYYLLALSVSVIIVNDVLLRGFIAGWPWALDASFAIAPFGFTFVAAAISHPNVNDLTAKPRFEDRAVGRQRFSLLAGALLVGPTLLVLSEFGVERIDPISTICGAAVIAMLVLLRMADLVRAKEGTSERERRLRDAATRLATATDRDGALRAAVDGSLEIATRPAASRASIYRLDGDRLVLLQSRGYARDEAAAHLPLSSLAANGVELEAGVVAFEGVAELDRPLVDDLVDIAVLPIGMSQPDPVVVLVTQYTGVFTLEQVASLDSFASQVSLALDGVRLREQLHQRRSNRRFRALVENSSDVVMVLDERGLVAFASPTVRRLLGREEAAVVGRPVGELVHRPDQLHARRVIATPASPGNDPSPVEVRMLHGSGELRWFELEARDLRGENEVQGIVITARDISDRKRAEAQLLRSEARFRLMVQNSSDVVAIMDPDSLLTYVSPSIERLLGYTAAELMGRSVFELLSVTEAERLRSLPFREIDGTSVELRIQATDGQVKTAEVAVTDMRHQPEVDGVVLNIRDVTERKSLQDDLRHQALHDDLTGLANRVAFGHRVEDAMAAAARTDSHVAVLFVDLDDFKLINDSLGHAVGDEVLLTVSDRIQQCLTLSDLAARLGGDEFAVMRPGVGTLEEVTEFASTLREAIGQPIGVGDNEFRLTSSIGVAVDLDGDRKHDDLIRSADLAMYQAKQTGKDRTEVFAEHMEASATEELELKSALSRAIENNEFVLHYQPIVDLATSQIQGVEALIRWEDPQRGMVSPASFIPVAEESGLIRQIGLWVAAQAALDLAQWRAMGFDLYCSVNVSGRQFDDEDFAERFVAAIEQSGVDASAIVVELTESVLAADGVVEVFDAFRQEGFRLAIDDFGTGYSAFQYLQSFDIDIIKIDRSFVRAMDTEDDAGVVEAVLDVARRVEAKALAEGIEDTNELRLLKQLGVELGQGYYFSRPVPAAKIRQLLVEEQSADLPAQLS
ncbi:MAG: EAL domain-containing protein [Actinomycetota bacterium]